MKGTRPSWSTDSNCLRYLDLGLSPRHTIAAHKELLWVCNVERHERFGMRLTSPHFCPILVYDITDVSTFNNVQKWVKEIESFSGSTCTLLLVGALPLIC